MEANAGKSNKPGPWLALIVIFLGLLFCARELTRLTGLQATAGQLAGAQLLNRLTAAKAADCRCGAKRLSAAQFLFLQLPLPLDCAKAADLTLLPGIGPKRAAKIIALRKRLNGRMQPLDLLKVKGIGEKIYAGLRGQVIGSSRQLAVCKAP